MKRIPILLLAFLLIAGVAWASPANKTIITSTILDDNPTSVTSSSTNIQDYKEVGFWVNVDETEVGGGVSVAVTLDISYNNSTWLDANFYDLAGGITLQTSETISSDGWYYCALPTLYNPAGSILYVRMVITGTGTDTDDTATVIAYLTGTK